MAEIFKAGRPEKDKAIDLSIDPSRQLSLFEKKILQVRKEAEEIRLEAERAAEGLIAEARSETERIRGDAYNEGIEKGKGESLARLDALAKSLQGEIEKIQQAHAELLRTSQGCIVDFGFKLAKIVIGSEIGNNPAIVEKHLARILDRLTIDGKVEISISEADYETIETYLHESGFNMDSGGYELKVDPSLTSGGVRVRTPTMGIDGSIEGMLQRVESVVNAMLNEDG
jgi:flagellar assembly protein FliH